jgi:UDP-2,4-diacetamido-2,4,6-trideoxy-beta-L-altropyranose hydrolase
MRCMALARHLVAKGHEAEFLCRALPGNLIALIEAQGLDVMRLTGTTMPGQIDDAASCLATIGRQRCDWLVVDHYELDATWEKAMSAASVRIFAIDDLGRHHDCSLLLDQNYANPAHDLYRHQTPPSTLMLLGPSYALLRPEFSALRVESLAQGRSKLERILVFMGGSDPMNETTKALKGIALAARPGLRIDAVIGSQNPHRQAVTAACGRLRDARLHVQTTGMAELMANADLAIGSGGSATWERCVLGLPAVVTVLAQNQVMITEAVTKAGAQRMLGWFEKVTPTDYAQAIDAIEPDRLRHMSANAAHICDGLGTGRVVDSLVSLSVNA